MKFGCRRYTSLLGLSDPEFISTGSSNVDELLRGGVCIGEVTEVFGKQGSGKTQFVFSLCRSVANTGGSALLIDADGSAEAQRLQEMQVAEDDVHVVRMCNADHILACLIHVLPKMLEKIGNVRLLILDSIAFVSRATTLDSPVKRCQIFAGRLGHLATRHNCAVVIVNDAKSAVETLPSISAHIGFSPIPTAAMGAQWSHACPTRLALVTSTDGTRYAVIVKSMRQASGHALFEIGYSGICDVQ